MKKIKNFIKTSIIGGLVVVLPVAVLAGIFNWMFSFVAGIIQPLTDIILVRSDIKEIVADLIVVITILIICFILGVVVKTSFGKFFYGFIENTLLFKIPGYTLVKETIGQFVGSKKSPFSSVALVNIFQNETLVTAFVTDEHEDGSFTVFVPTGPNPTSGNIYHLKAAMVTKVDVSVESAMKSIISCGSGSQVLIDAFAGNSKK